MWPKMENKNPHILIETHNGHNPKNNCIMFQLRHLHLPKRCWLTTFANPAKATSTTLPKHSGIQKQVFQLYRSLLRAAVTVDKKRLLREDVSSHPKTDTSHNSNLSSSSFVHLLNTKGSTTSSVQHRFRNKAENVTRREIDRIEYGIRQGEKYVTLLQMEGVSGGSLR